MCADAPWRTAWARAARVPPDDEWPPAPGVPLAALADVGFDPRGRWVLLVGYEAVHLLDLETMRSRVVVEDARLERSVRVGADGSRALVCDGYADRVHVVELPAGHVTTRDDAPRKTWSALTRRLLGHGRADRDVAVRAERRLRAEGADAILVDPGGRHLLRAPTADGFGTVRRVGLAADGRPLVFADCRASPSSTDPAPTLCLYAAAPPFDLLGVVQLALRRPEPNLVFQHGRALPAEALGGVIQVQVRGQAQKALRRFAAPEDAPTVERPFARTAEGLMGRLDVDAPIGAEAVPHVERPADVRARLRGEPFLAAGPDADARANYADRARFWAARAPAGGFDGLMTASRALTPLLPEIWRRARRAGRPGRKRLMGACRALAGANAAARAAAFEDMCRWLRRVAAVGRLSGAPASGAPTVDLVAACWRAAEAVVLEAAACVADDADAGVRASVGAALAPRLAADATLLESLSEGCLLCCLSLVDDALQPALIERLGAVGSERAVAPLTEVGGGLFTPAARQAAARAATDAIAKRIGGLRGGGLSVVEGDRRGGLSVPAPEDD